MMNSTQMLSLRLRHKMLRNAQRCRDHAEAVAASLAGGRAIVPALPISVGIGAGSAPPPAADLEVRRFREVMAKLEGNWQHVKVLATTHAGYENAIFRVARSGGGEVVDKAALVNDPEVVRGVAVASGIAWLGQELGRSISLIKFRKS